MKKKILILAAIAVSGIAAVVASNTNAFVGDAEAQDYEYVANNGMWCFCIESSGICRVGTKDGIVVHRKHYPESCTFNF